MDLTTTRKNTSNSKVRRKPSSTPEGRENQMISLAVDLAEKQIREGSASSQVISHFLKLGTTRERLEQEKLRRENDFLAAKSEQLASGQRMEELYGEAINAMRSYAGHEVMEDPDD